MTLPIIWSEDAINSATAYLADDPVGLKALFARIDVLAEQPRPTESAPYGSPDLRRLRVGQYRVLYEISGSIEIIHVGRTG